MDGLVNAPAPKQEQARTRLARAAVAGSARRLFLEQGYAATTVDAVSRASGVPAATIYRLFTSKAGILSTVLDLAAGGDDEPVAFGDRPEIRAALALEDPRELLRFFAQLTPDFMARVAPVHHILVGAAATDPDAAVQLIESNRQRQEGQARIAAALAHLGALRPGLDERGAADLIHAFMSPELYLLLVDDRGWTSDRYAAWLADVLAGQLLAARP